MEKPNREVVYSKKVRAGRRRTYFFDVRQTKGDDYFITLTESARRFNGDGYERHKLLLYKEDFNRFLAELQDVVNYIKTELMPDFDYDEFTRRQEEYESQRESLAEGAEPRTSENDSEEDVEDINEKKSSQHDKDDDLSW
ncbi:MAG: DUF3276 family protein [Saprospiraceae bacterium]|nr:DUF3276 family protein [Saprospiraceae bacterium]MBP7699412.1 DUF3276 family protein [Saprospiraceae bacterium]